jgi:hypothetical protein
MTRQEFITLVNDEVTADCALPFNVPTKAINRMIDKLAKPWFYRNYEYALEERYLIINQGYENSEMFKKEKTVKLPDCIFSVYSVRDTGGNSLFGNADSDIYAEKFLVQQSGVGTLDLAPENLVYATFNLLYLDIIEQFTHQAITFGYNHLTHKLTLNGEISFTDVVLTVAKKIPDENLFDDEYFLKYVAGLVKKNLGRALGTAKMPLIGNAEIDFGEIKDEGKEDMQEVEDDIKGDEGVDYFFMSPQ